MNNTSKKPLLIVYSIIETRADNGHKSVAADIVTNEYGGEMSVEDVLTHYAYWVENGYDQCGYSLEATEVFSFKNDNWGNTWDEVKTTVLGECPW